MSGSRTMPKVSSPILPLDLTGIHQRSHQTGQISRRKKWGSTLWGLPSLTSGFMSHSCVLHILRRVLMLLGVRKVRFYNLHRTFGNSDTPERGGYENRLWDIGALLSGVYSGHLPLCHDSSPEDDGENYQHTKKLKSDMSPAKRAVWRECTAGDPELVPMRVKIWISSQWPKINRQKSCKNINR